MICNLFSLVFFVLEDRLLEWVFFIVVVIGLFGRGFGIVLVEGGGGSGF